MFSSDARRRAEASETEPTSDQLVPPLVVYFSEPFAVLTAVIAMPFESPDSTSAMPAMRVETRVPAVEFPFAGAAVSSSMAVRAGDSFASRVGASLTALTVIETVSVLCDAYRLCWFSWSRRRA